MKNILTDSNCGILWTNLKKVRKFVNGCFKGSSQSKRETVNIDFFLKLNLTCKVFLNIFTGWKYSTGFINEQMLKDHIFAPSNDTLILMCGPPPMINYACMPNLEKIGHKKEQCFAY